MRLAHDPGSSALNEDSRTSGRIAEVRRATRSRGLTWGSLRGVKANDMLGYYHAYVSRTGPCPAACRDSLGRHDALTQLVQLRAHAMKQFLTYLRAGPDEVVVGLPLPQERFGSVV